MATVGTLLPGAVALPLVEVRLTRAVALLWCEAVAVPFDHDRLHPSLAYHVAMEAVDYPSLFARLLVTARDRAVAGEISLDIHRAVEVDRDYLIRASVDPVEHKHGARSGPLEKLTVRSAVYSAGCEEPDFSVTATILVTRGAA